MDDDAKDVGAAVLSWLIAAFAAVALAPLLYWIACAVLTIFDALPEWMSFP